MQLKTLFCENFNKTLFRKNLSRFWPLWVMPSFVGALFPLAMLTQLLRYGVDNFFGNENALEFTSMYYEVVVFAIPIISLCYAILVAIAVWSYLFNSRSVGMMHTLPLRREGLFLTNFLSGMAMLLIPYVVTGGLCILISLVCGFFEPVGILVTIAAVIGESLFYFASATLVAFITGNFFAMPVLYFLLHFLAVGLDALVNAFAEGFLFGVSNGYSGAVEFLSPTVYLMRHVRCDRNYTDVFVPDLLNGYATEHGIGYLEHELVSVSLENGWLIAAYALLGVVLLCIAYALYRRRRSESAGDVVSVGWMKPVFRYGTAICGSVLGGIVLYAIFWGSFQNGSYYDVVPLVICMILAGAICYYAASMLLAKSLRVFKGSGKGVGLTALCAILICSALHFDLFGVESRVPTVDQVKEVTLYAAGNNYTFDPEKEAELLEQVREFHKTLVADADFAIAARERDLYTGIGWEQETYSFETVRLNYQLKNGMSVNRRYRLILLERRMEQPGTYDDLLDQLINSEEMKAKRFHLNDGWAASGGYLYAEKSDMGGTSFGNREAEQLMEAIRKDIASGTCGTYAWYGENSGNEYAVELNLEFEKDYLHEDGTTSRDYDSIHVVLWPEMTNTVNCLLRLGLVEPEHLVTRAELWPEQYGMEEWEYLEKYGYAAIESYPTYAESASVGIIGGADGPTEVFVTVG